MITEPAKYNLLSPEATDLKSAHPRISPLLPLLAATFMYLFSLILSMTPITRMSKMNKTLWISQALLWFGNRLPYNLGLSRYGYVSRQETLYVELILLLVLAFLAYSFCALYIYRQKEIYYRSVLILIGSGALIGGCIYLFTPGTLSNDIYSYVSYGRILAIHAANPYFVPPSAFPQDPTYQYIYWRDTVSIYGPIWTLISAPLSLLAGQTQLHFLLTMRIFGLIMHLLNVFLVMMTLRTLGRSNRIVLIGALLYAWNPLLLLENCLGGHNDVLMITFILLGLWLSARAEQAGTPSFRAALPALLSFTLAALVKFSAAPVVAIFILELFFRVLRSGGMGQQLRWWPALRDGMGACIISASLAVLLYSPFWLGHSITTIVNGFTSTPSAQQAFNSVYFSLATWNSGNALPAAFLFLLNRHTWGTLSELALVLPLLAGLVFLWHTPMTRTIALVALATLGTFLLLTPWFFAWYVTWLVPLAVVALPAERDRLGRALVGFALTFSATALLTYYSNIIGWLLATFKPPLVGWLGWIGWGTFGVPVLVFLVLLVLKPAKQRDSA